MVDNMSKRLIKENKIGNILVFGFAYIFQLVVVHLAGCISMKMFQFGFHSCGVIWIINNIVALKI